MVRPPIAPIIPDGMSGMSIWEVTSHRWPSSAADDFPAASKTARTAATAAKKERLRVLSASRAEVESLLTGKRVAGRPVERLVVGDGIKVVLVGGVWVLKRASGTEDIIKDYREERGETLETARRASEEIDRLLGLA